MLLEMMIIIIKIIRKKIIKIMTLVIIISVKNFLRDDFPPSCENHKLS